MNNFIMGKKVVHAKWELFLTVLLFSLAAQHQRSPVTSTPSETKVDAVEDFDCKVECKVEELEESTPTVNPESPLPAPAGDTAGPELNTELPLAEEPIPDNEPQTEQMATE